MPALREKRNKVYNLFSSTIENGCGDMANVNSTPRQKPIASSSAVDDRPVAIVMLEGGNEGKEKRSKREKESNTKCRIKRDQLMHEQHARDMFVSFFFSTFAFSVKIKQKHHITFKGCFVLKANLFHSCSFFSFFCYRGNAKTLQSAKGIHDIFL